QSRHPECHGSPGARPGPAAVARGPAARPRRPSARRHGGAARSAMVCRAGPSSAAAGLPVELTEAMMMHLAEYRPNAALLADHLPWAALVAPGVVLNKDGSFQRSFRFRGPDLDSATDGELLAACARVN